MKKILLVITLILSMSISVFAQKTDTLIAPNIQQHILKEIIIKGNRLETPFHKINRNVQVITQKQIKALPAKSLNGVLAYIGGVDIRQRGPFGTQADISIDGGTSEQTLVLINGVKMIDSQTAHNMMNLPIPLSAVEYIEILKGPAARVYGINALTGAINIVTKNEGHSSVITDIKGGSSLKRKDKRDGTGIYGGGSVEITGIYGTKKQSQLVGVSQANYNGQRYNSASKVTKLFYTGNYNFDSENSLKAMAGYAQSKFGANGFYAAPHDINSEELVETSIFSLSSKHRFGNLIISPRISDRYGEDDYRFYKDDLSKGRSLHYTNALMFELNSSLITTIGTFGFGFESRFETINSSNIGEHNRNNYGGYAELKTNLGENLKSTIGLYTNYNTDYGLQLYPGIDITYLINNNWKVATSIGSGQRIPSFTDLYLNQRPGNIGNPLLQPEDSWSYDGNIQYKNNSLYIKAGYFYRNIKHFIDWVRDNASDPYSPTNFGKNKVHALYGRVQQSFNLGSNKFIGYTASYNYLSPSLVTSAESQSKYTLESLKHQFITGVYYRNKYLSFHLMNRLYKRELGTAYNVLDLRINYHLSNFELYTEVTNIFDTFYSEAGAVPMPTRWIGLGVKYQWTALQ